MSDKPLPPPQPLNQSLPPLPPLQTKELPKMNITRRPVAKQPAPPPQEAEQPSPTGSIGSLLSAYSRSSGESLMKSPGGSSYQRDSAPLYPSDQDGTREAKILTPTSPSSGDNEASYSHFGAPNFTTHKGLPPAPGYQRGQAAPPPPAKSGQEAGVSSPTSFESASSPQRPIWRRRSVKSDRNIEVPDLKLSVSHGSTAASTPNTTQPSSTTAPPPAQQFPPRTTSGLPGRNIRPIHLQNLPPAPAEEEMGQEASRLKQKVTRLRGEEGANVGASHSDTALSPSQRLPTPDYEKEDVKTPVVDTVVSPISPASSPEPAADQASAEAKPPIPRKAVTQRNVHNAQSLPQLRVEQPTTNSEAPPTITRDFAVSPTSPPTQGHFPARTTSNQQPQQPQQQQQQQQQQRGQWQPAAREHAPAPAFAQQNGHMRSASRDQRPGQEPVEYRDMKELDPPADPRASFFPITTPEPPSPGIVYNARPLKESMFDCYVRHRTMDRTRNRNYALTCQTCGKADTEDRFKCQWCYVRMCAACFHVFNDNRRDLRKLVAHLDTAAQNGEAAHEEQPAEQAPAQEIQRQQPPQVVAA
ncbi:hypothetical protein CkaCkLH20_08458 [Colletotrichum karsti]|uniref:Uncharacterized protein n=1 Tax=Colletotrichum karsti TaxID=1095194 RepID=A0A9P6I4Z0_9PEZI|nr:uncharacterized protein CkaCkLH20_08458 [Colletotrichum karsti]KAF9874086.1 hypothetical protein CkaCkLH20_08458 [Colletotrichum karsti]